MLAEIRAYFPGTVLSSSVRSNVKLAEAPSFGKTIFQYAPDSNGAQDYLAVAREIALGEARDPDLAGLPPIPASPPRMRAPKETTGSEVEAALPVDGPAGDGPAEDVAPLPIVVLTPKAPPEESVAKERTISPETFPSLEGYVRRG